MSGLILSLNIPDLHIKAICKLTYLLVSVALVHFPKGAG
jgi:hypothetical protein